MSPREPFLSRWSARKRAEATPPAPEAEPSPQAAPDPTELEANRAAAEAVDLDSLDKDSDLSVFLRDGVPDLLRNAALQKVWRSNPVFANLDELVDYGEDFGRKDLILESFKSAWQAGRGYLDQIEPETAAIADTEATPAPTPAAQEPPSQPEIAATEPLDAAPLAEPAPPLAPALDTPAPEAKPPKRHSLRARLAVQTDPGTAGSEPA
ncbi:MAG: DUF3306 domain-containing protein [Mangrovicoccus sp.]|nr:DUF3306 domain-containing protein [Mangrovicoccus sp.]